MTFSPRSLGGLAAVALLTLAGPAFAQNKAVFQVSDADPIKWNLAIGNALNMQKAVGADHVDIEIVGYGPGIAGLKAGSPLAARVSEAVRNRIRVYACENTMAAQNLAHGDMLADVAYVPAGVVEIMQKQQQGYAYIRP